MHHRRWISLVGLVAALTGLTMVAIAQSMGPIAVHATGSGTLESFLVPAQPNYLSLKLTGTGQDPVNGTATAIAHIRAPLSPEGQVVAGRDGLGVITAANGDRLFVTVDGVVHIPANAAPGAFMFDSVFTITGGTGRLAAAAGSGTLLVQGDLKKGQYTYRLDGTVSPLGR